MFGKCMEDLQAKGYVFSCHYNTILHELYITVTDSEKVKSASTTLPYEYLSDDEGMAIQINRLIDRLEGAENARS